MNTTNSTADSSFYWVDGIKVRKRIFGKKPVSERFVVPTNLTNPQRPKFTLRWEDPPEGLSVVVSEDDVGRMIAHVTVKGNTTLTALSVGLVGTVENEVFRKTVPIIRTNETDGYGSSDIGSLTELAKRLGDTWWVVVFPVV